MLYNEQTNFDKIGTFNKTNIRGDYLRAIFSVA